MEFIWLLALLGFSHGKLTTKSLDDVIVYAEDLGEVRLYHQSGTLINVLDSDNLYNRLHQVHTALELVQEQCNGHCYEAREIELITGRLDRVKLLHYNLDHILGYGRQRRGLINGIGTLSKALFGTLNEDDLALINANMDKLFNDNEKMSQSIANQTIIMRTLLDSTSHDIHKMNEQTRSRLDELNGLVNATNKNLQNLQLANQLLACTISIQEISEDVNLLINAINDGKHGIIHPQLLTPKQTISEMKKLEEEQNIMYPVKLTEYNYQHIIDISELSVFIIDRRLTYSLRVPIPETDTLQYLHLIPIPKPHGNTFLAAIPTHEIILINKEKNFYVPGDFTSMKSCKSLGEIKICKRIQPSYFLSEIHSCESELFKSTIKTLDSKICQISVFKIQELVYIPLYSDNQYILIPEKNLEINTICEGHAETITLNTATFIAGTNCIIQTPKSMLKLSGPVSMKTNVLYKKNVSMPFQETELELLKDSLPSIQETLTHARINEFKTTLRDIESSMKTVRDDRRRHSWVETGHDVLRYIGYTAIGIIVVYLSYKIGLFKCISKLMPKNLCIKLFCMKTTVNATPQTYVVPVAPVTQSERLLIEETEIVRPRNLRLKIRD